MLRIRHAAKGTEFATAQVERLRSMLIKGTAKVTVSSRRVLVELSNYCPFAEEIRQITAILNLKNQDELVVLMGSNSFSIKEINCCQLSNTK